MASLAFALGALDGLEVDAVGFKNWHETMTLGTFLRSGFGLFAGGHTGMTWRIILRMTAVFGFAHAVYVAVWTRARVPLARA